jgi:hypothetical protein
LTPGWAFDRLQIWAYAKRRDRVTDGVFKMGPPRGEIGTRGDKDTILTEQSEASIENRGFTGFEGLKTKPILRPETPNQTEKSPYNLRFSCVFLIYPQQAEQA